MPKVFAYLRFQIQLSFIKDLEYARDLSGQFPVQDLI